jgi:hypothetical protein
MQGKTHYCTIAKIDVLLHKLAFVPVKLLAIQVSLVFPMDFNQQSHNCVSLSTNVPVRRVNAHAL